MNFRLIIYSLAAALGALIPIASVLGSVTINEFVASNGNTLADEDGDYEDWIELFNHGDTSVNLQGYGLSDDLSRPFRWVFPAVEIGPGEFLLVWASGKNRTAVGHELHTNFSIGASGEPLLLSRPDGSVADEVEPVALDRDLSYGRQPDGTGTWGYFAEPTPKSANSTTQYTEWLEPPLFSHGSGFHSSEFVLNLQTQSSGAGIIYTLDGSVPETNSIGVNTFSYKNEYPGPSSSGVGPLLTGDYSTHTYDGPIAIADRSQEPNRLSRVSSTPHSFPPNYIPGETDSVFKGTVVRARAVKEGALPSKVVTRTYFVHPDAEDRYSLPVISVVLPEESIFGYDQGIYTAGYEYDYWWLNNPGQRSRQTWQRPANYTMRGVDWEREGHLSIFVPGEGMVVDQGVGYRIHGGASRSYPQKTLRIYARRDYDTDNSINYPFFEDILDILENPVTSFRRLILRNSGNDNPNSRFRDGFLQELVRPIGLDDQGFRAAVHFVNGEFWGHVNIRERIDRHYIAARHLIDPDDVSLLTARSALLIDDEDPDDIDPLELQDEADFMALRAFIEQQDMADPQNFSAVEEQMDVENFLLYNMLQVYIDNADWPHNNNDYWRKRTPDTRPGAPKTHDGRWRWIVYDLDQGFGLYGGTGNVSRNSLNQATNPNPSPGWDGTDRRFSTVMLRNLLDNEAFRNRFINAFLDHIASTFRPSRAHAIIDRMNNEIAPVRDGEHRTRWGGMMSSNNHVDIMKQFASQRPTAMEGHILSFFGLQGGFRNTVFDVSDTDAGALQINTLMVGRGLQTLPDPDQPFPFSARYHPEIPIEIEAVPNPGYRFVGWQEFPEHEGPKISLNVAFGTRVTAIFEKSEEPLIIAYWNYNDTNRLLEPTVSRTGAQLSFSGSESLEITDGGGNGFIAENARGGDPAGRHLRVNNPLGSHLLFAVSTENYGAPRISYETRRSGQGAGLQLIEYSVDGSVFEEFALIPVVEGDPLVHEFDFSTVDAASDNRDFKIRISFLQGEGGLAGNNRIDNFTVIATPLGQADPDSHWSYGSWRWANFPDPADRENDQISAPHVVHAESGLSNLRRYASNLSINAEPTADEIVVGMEWIDDKLHLSVPAFNDKQDLYWQLQSTTDFRDWISADAIIGDAWTARSETVTVVGPGSNQSLFLRFILELGQ